MNLTQELKQFHRGRVQTHPIEVSATMDKEQRRKSLSRFHIGDFRVGKRQTW